MCHPEISSYLRKGHGSTAHAPASNIELSIRTCLRCSAKHHTSICDDQANASKQVLPGTVKGLVVYPVVVALMDRSKCRFLLGTGDGDGNSYISMDMVKLPQKQPSRTKYRCIEMIRGFLARRRWRQRRRENGVKMAWHIHKWAQHAIFTSSSVSCIYIWSKTSRPRREAKNGGIWRPVPVLSLRAHHLKWLTAQRKQR